MIAQVVRERQATVDGSHAAIHFLSPPSCLLEDLVIRLQAITSAVGDGGGRGPQVAPRKEQRAAVQGRKGPGTTRPSVRDLSLHASYT